MNKELLKQILIKQSQDLTGLNPKYTPKPGDADYYTKHQEAAKAADKLKTEQTTAARNKTIADAAAKRRKQWVAHANKTWGTTNAVTGGGLK